jgi:opacity protein-like surface antigen
MRNYISAIVAMAGLAAVPMAAAAQESGDPNAYTGNVWLLLGEKFLDSGDWAPTENQFEFGLLCDGRIRSWPVSIAADFRYSVGIEDTGGATLVGSTFELNLGVRKYIDFDPHSGLHFFVGGGLTIGYGEVEVTVGTATASDSGSGAGIWIDMGLVIELSQGFGVGLELAYSVLPVTFDAINVDADAGGFHVGFLIGWHF